MSPFGHGLIICAACPSRQYLAPVNFRTRSQSAFARSVASFISVALMALVWPANRAVLRTMLPCSRTLLSAQVHVVDKLLASGLPLS